MKDQNRAWFFPHAKLADVGNVYKAVREEYSSLPLHVFSDIAKTEISNSPDAVGLWGFLFDDIDYYTRRPGIFGMIHDNSLIDMRPYDSKDRDSHQSRSVERRRTMKDWSGFIDCTYTALSLEAGKIRSLVHGCLYRVLTDKVYNQASSILDCIEASDDESAGWRFLFASKSCTMSQRSVGRIIATWNRFQHHNSPSIHVWPRERTIVMHISSGCVMKPVTTRTGRHWVDSTCYNTPGMLHLLCGKHRATTDDVADNVRTTMHLIPFFLHDEPPRPTLASSMSHQALCRPRVGLTSTTAATTSYLPVVRTPMMQRLIDTLTDTRFISVPGVSLLVVFANMRMNYEDSLIVSQHVNDEKLFRHFGVIHHPVKDGVPTMKRGDIITEKDDWFRPYANAKVLREGVSSKMSRYVTAEMSDDRLHEGDKLATWHGQKFTVSEIIPEERMPIFTCTATRKKLRPHMIVASSSVHNRGTIGQIFEAWAGMNCVGDTNFDPRTCEKYVICDPFRKSDIPANRFTCEISDPSLPLRSTDGSRIIADYGICNFWQLSHISRDKQHYVSDIPRGVAMKKGKLNRSGVRFGEAECLSAMSGGLVNCLSYLSDNGDLSIVDVCQKCRRLVINCDCEEGWTPSTKVVVRNALAKFDVMRTAYSVNGAMGLEKLGDDEERAQVEGRRTSVPFIAESFTYHA
ncbi:unnamed protein product [Peronospora belbahrii]|uniref:DNA-directed RNA polymerase n=1 Tax=Peronospora belbahrii TaxID=622444 RepID=A0AAU9KTJ4_9STRA|nr:unnamed protein product [Peronospora belbahrii]